MALSCGAAARVSLAAAGGHAVEAERLELEAHLASCQRCSDQHGTLLAVVRGLANTEPGAMTAAARETVRQALAARAPIARVSLRRNPWPRRTGAGLTLAAAAVICVLVFRGRPDRTLVQAPVQAQAQAQAPVQVQVIEGDVTIEPVPTDSVPAAVVLRSVKGGRAQLADVAVDMAGEAEISWNAGGRWVDLRRGTVTVDVEHRAGQHLEVRTARFTIEVLGTRFTVDQAGVRTLRGVVRVIHPDGSVAARVEAGGRWSVDLDADGGGTHGPTASAENGTRPVEIHHRVAGPVVNAGGDLAEARRALVRGDALAARRIVAPLFRLSRKIAVEARVLFAESFLIEGRYADAIDGYRLVVRDFPSMDQAETAQFAIAELESEHGRGVDARAALQAYVARYPHGRFSREAALRLGQLSPHER